VLRTVRLLNIRRLRRQPLRALLAVAAMAAGVTLTVSVLVVKDSVTTSFARIGGRLAGPAPLRVVGPMSRGGLDERVVPKVEAVDGVAAVIPAVQTVTYAERPDGSKSVVLALGLDCRVEALLGPFGCSRTAAGAPGAASLVTSAALARALGAEGSIRTDLYRVPLRGAATLPGLDTLNNGRVVVFPLAAAQKLFDRPGRLDVAYVVPRPGTSVAALRHRIEQAVGSWNGVLRATDPPPGEGAALGAFLPLFILLAVFSLAIGAVLIGNIAALSLEERRRDLAITQAIGATPGVVLSGALAEAAALGLAGGLVGAAGAFLLAHPVLAGLGSVTERITGLKMAVHMAPGLVVLAAVAGTLVALAATWRPARRAMRSDVAAELSSRGMRAETAPRVSARRAGAYTVLALAGLLATALARRRGGLEPWAPAAAELGVAACAGGFILAVGSVAPALLRLAERPAARADTTLRLALTNLVREPRRTSVMTAAVAGAVGTAFMIGSAVLSIRTGILRSFERSQTWVSASVVPENNAFNLDARLSPASLAKLASVPGVGRVHGGAFVLTGLRAAEQIGVAANDSPVFPFRLVAGDAGPVAFAHGRVLVGTTLARQGHLRPGSTVALKTPTGIAHVSVGGIWQAPDNNGRGAYLPMPLFESLFGRQPDGVVGITPAPGASVGDVARSLRAAAPSIDPDLQIRTPAETGRDVGREVSGFVAPFWALQRGMLLVAFVAVLSTLLLVGVQRRRELGLMAAVGMTPQELGRMALTEAGAIGVLGSVLGTVAGAGMLMGFFGAAPIMFGIGEPVHADLRAPLVDGILALVVVLAGAALPAWRTVRLQVVEALQYE
jgi:putative ABC transport system permease protein